MELRRKSEVAGGDHTVPEPQGVSARRGREVLPDSDALVESFGLIAGASYRIAYSVGTARSRRLTRSTAIFEGRGVQKAWNGASVECLRFRLPHGREIVLLQHQLVDVRASTRNERGQWVLQDSGAPRRRVAHSVPAIDPSAPGWAHLLSR